MRRPEQTNKVLSFSETELALLRSYNGGAASLLSLLHVQFCDMWILGKSDFQLLDYHDVILMASSHLTTTCSLYETMLFWLLTNHLTLDSNLDPLMLRQVVQSGQIYL